MRDARPGSQRTPGREYPKPMKRSEDSKNQEPFPHEEENEGAVVEWLARDARDHVAMFTAIGCGDFAPSLVEELQEHRRALSFILDVHPVTRSVFGPAAANELAHRWRALAERGLFVFAAYRPGGPYWIAEAPREPLHAAELPTMVSDVLARLPRVALPFKHVASLTPDVLGIDLSGATWRRPS
jgi:hypothetical protein